MDSIEGSRLVIINRFYPEFYCSYKCLLYICAILLATCFLITSVDCLIASENSIVNSYPIIYEDGQDNYLLLSDDELVKNAEILRYLSSSTKEEVEEIVDGNPMIQNQLLDRVTKIVRQRQKSKSVNKQKQKQVISGGPDIKGHPQVYEQQQMTEYDVDDNEKDDNEDKDDKGDEGKKRNPNYNKRIKLLLLKAKLKKKAIKWFKIGSKLKKKLVMMAKKRKNKGKGGFFRIATQGNDGEYDEEEYEGREKNDQKSKARTSRPRFRFRISTSG